MSKTQIEHAISDLAAILANDRRSVHTYYRAGFFAAIRYLCDTSGADYATVKDAIKASEQAIKNMGSDLPLGESNKHGNA